MQMQGSKADASKLQRLEAALSQKRSEMAGIQSTVARLERINREVGFPLFTLCNPLRLTSPLTFTVQRSNAGAVLGSSDQRQPRCLGVYASRWVSWCCRRTGLTQQSYPFYLLPTEIENSKEESLELSSQLRTMTMQRVR